MSEAKSLKVTIVQTSLQWENPQANLYHFKQLLESAKPTTDVIVLPEMFPTGFSMNVEELAELPNGTSCKWMKRIAEEYDAAVVGSIITREAALDGNDQFFNRLHWVTPDGEYQTYDKRHLFSFAKEPDYYSAGSDRLIVEYKGWRICPQICYDLRFPVWSRNASLAGENDDSLFDLLIYVANWPEARRKPWMTLLEARAHENQVYVVGMNRIGDDGNDINHSGDSLVFSPKGEQLSETESGKESVETVELSMDELTSFREKFTAWRDKDQFKLV